MSQQFFRRLLPFAVSIGLLVVLATYAPWHQVFHILADFDLGTILLLLALSILYYGLKSWRYLHILRAMQINQPTRLVIVSYLSAQPVSLLPGGELYRSTALEHYTGVPVKESLPQFTMQGLLEGAGLCLIAFVSALALRTLRVPFLLLGIVIIAMAIAIRRGYVAHFSRLINRLPFVNITEHTIQELSKRHREVISSKNLPFLVIVSIMIEIVGTLIAYVSVLGLGGHLNLFQAALFYVVPLIAGFLSLLPGGLGVSEHSGVAILLLSHVHVGLAVAATLIMRVSITGIGVLFGLLADVYGRTRLLK